MSGRVPKLSLWLCEKGIKQWDRLRRGHSHSSNTKYYAFKTRIPLKRFRVVNGPTSSGPNPARTHNISPNPKTNWKPKLCPNKPEVKLGLKNLAMLPSYFDYIFVRLTRNARLRPELSPKFLSTLGPNPSRKARPDLQLWSGLTFEFCYSCYRNPFHHKQIKSELSN